MILLLGLGLIGPITVVAHDGSTTSMEIPVERVPPGSDLPLIGLDFFPGERLRIRMTGAAAPVDVGVVEAGPDGHFEQTVGVPAAMPPGRYTVDAISSSGIINRALVTVDPAAPPASSVPLFPLSPPANSASSIDPTPIAALILAVAALGVLLLRTGGPSSRR